MRKYEPFCDDCGKTVSADQLLYHWLSFHASPTKSRKALLGEFRRRALASTRVCVDMVTCDSCFRACRLGSLSRHIASAHSISQRPVAAAKRAVGLCQPCGVQRRPEHIFRHWAAQSGAKLSSRQPDPVGSCEECGARLRVPVLGLHWHNRHTIGRPLPYARYGRIIVNRRCDDCRVEIRSSVALMGHWLSFHSPPSAKARLREQQRYRRQGNLRQIRRSCDVCGQSRQSIRSLLDHISRHAADQA